MSDLCCPHPLGLTWDVACLSVTMTLTCPDTLHQDTPQPRWDVWGTRYLYTYYIVSQHHLAKTTNITMWSPLSHQVNSVSIMWLLETLIVTLCLNSLYFHPLLHFCRQHVLFLPLASHHHHQPNMCCELLLVWPFLIYFFILQTFQM